MSEKPTNWINNASRRPDTPGYYEIKYSSGDTDEKYYRIRGNLRGWMVEDKEVIAWRELE